MRKGAQEDLSRLELTTTRGAASAVPAIKATRENTTFANNMTIRWSERM
jgi:hypothetical protein